MSLKDFVRDTVDLGRDDLFKVDVKEGFSFFNTDAAVAERVMEVLNSAQHNGRSVNVEISKSGGGGGGRRDHNGRSGGRSGGSGGGGFKKRRDGGGPRDGGNRDGGFRARRNEGGSDRGGFRKRSDSSAGGGDIKSKFSGARRSRRSE